MSALPMQDLRLAAAAEQEDPRVLEEPAEDRADLDVLGQARHPGPQRADAAHPDVDLHAGLRGAVERVDERLVDDGVDLACDAPGPGLAGLLVLDLGLDQLDQAGAHGSRARRAAA